MAIITLDWSFWYFAFSVSALAFSSLIFATFSSNSASAPSSGASGTSYCSMFYLVAILAIVEKITSTTSGYKTRSFWISKRNLRPKSAIFYFSLQNFAIYGGGRSLPCIISSKVLFIVRVQIPSAHSSFANNSVKNYSIISFVN